MVPELPAEYDAWTAPWRGYELHFYSLERVRSLGQPVFARVFLREGLELEVAGRMLVVGHLRWRVATTGGERSMRKPEAKGQALRPRPPLLQLVQIAADARSSRRRQHTFKSSNSAAAACFYELARRRANLES